MCPPHHYGVEYVINPWMEGNIGKVDRTLATKQWEDLYNAVSEHATVELIEPHRSMPDMVFTANAGVVIPWRDLFVVSYMSKPQRQQEQHLFGAWFERRGYYVRYLDNELNINNFFEGEGDCLIGERGGTHYSYKTWAHFGYKKRSTYAGTREAYGAMFDNPLHFYSVPHSCIDDQLSLPMLSYELQTDQFYHLDTCLAVLKEKRVLYDAALFATSAQSTIPIAFSIFDEEADLHVSEEDANQFACNMIVVGRQIIMPVSSPELKAQLKSLGYQVTQLDMSEFIKAGGACKCLVLTLGGD